MDKTIGIVGGGNMGGSIARGLVEAGVCPAESVLVADHGEAHRAAFAEAGMRVFANETELAAAAPDVLVLAVKPQVLMGACAALADVARGRLVISIAAGVTLSALEAALPGARLVRAMPNLPVQVRSGATAIARGTHATDEDVALAVEVFSALGVASVMREDQLDVAGAVSGTAPAFFSLFVDTLTRAGVKAGLPSAACRQMLVATMAGTAAQLAGDDAPHPRAYMERVTSPGGTTAAALYELEPALYDGSFDAVAAALARTAELAGR